MRIARRDFLRVGAGLAAGVLLPATGTIAASGVTLQVWKDPWCGCCTGWAKHMELAGYLVSVAESDDMDGLKDRLAVPQALRSCHTGELAGYVLEGHVPALAVARLLAERPAITGLAVPGMPMGSPGMEGPADSVPDLFEVIAFGAGREETFMRFRGGSAV